LLHEKFFAQHPKTTVKLAKRLEGGGGVKMDGQSLEFKLQLVFKQPEG
jgi:hypothetical protein